MVCASDLVLQGQINSKESIIILDGNVFDYMYTVYNIMNMYNNNIGMRICISLDVQNKIKQNS